MSRRKHPAPDPPSDRREPTGPVFTIQLGLSGIIGIGVVVFCLFLWMFLLGIWAGQTILYPPQPPPASGGEVHHPTERSPAAPELRPVPNSEGVLLLPSERKRRISAPEPAGIRAE